MDRFIQTSRGFTILEILVAISIAGLVLGLAVPASIRFYHSMQYRQAVHGVVTSFQSARYKAINTGQAQDVTVDPDTRTIDFNSEHVVLSDDLRLIVKTARELNTEGKGVFRFYPEGGSTGGALTIERPGRSGVRISVDWLLGKVSQEAYVVD